MRKSSKSYQSSSNDEQRYGIILSSTGDPDDSTEHMRFYKFPVCRGVQSTLSTQVRKVVEEASEIVKAHEDDEGTDRIIEETLDCIHACETLLRKFPISRVLAMRGQVYRKNKERGYYVGEKDLAKRAGGY